MCSWSTLVITRNRRRQLEERTIALVRLGDHELAAGRAARCCRTRSAVRRSPRSDRARRAPAPAPPSTSWWSCRARRRSRCRTCRRISSASISARGITGICPRPRLDHLRVGVPTADDTTTTSAAPTLRGVVARGRRARRAAARRSVTSEALSVRPADVVAEVGEQLGDPAHANPPDADEVNAARAA